MRRHCLCTDDGGGPENENRAVFFGFTVGTGKTMNSKRQMVVSNLGGIYGKRNQLPEISQSLIYYDGTTHSGPKWRKSARLMISSIYTMAFSRIFIP